MLDAEIQEFARELLIEVDIETVITDISSNCYQFFGYTKPEIIGTSIKDFIIEEFIIECEDTTSLELTLKSKLGENIYCDALISSDRNGNTKISLININKYKELELWESRFRRMIENTKDMVYLYDIIPEQKFVYVNRATFTSLGTHPETAYSNPMYPFDIAHPDDLYVQYKKIDKTTDFSKPLQSRMQNSKGEYVWFEDNVIPFFDDNGDLKSISGFCRNIQDRKELEQKLEELSYHDSLTGLFSNNYYAAQVKRFNESYNCSLGIIMCDLDNLKTINDTMGHAYGDKLIINFANLLKNEFGNHSILIRKGGDEFIIMVENTAEEFTLQLYSRLLHAMDYYNNTYPLLPLKASVGWAYTPTSLGQVEKTFKSADEMMYSNKMDKKYATSQNLSD